MLIKWLCISSYLDCLDTLFMCGNEENLIVKLINTIFDRGNTC